MADRAGARTTDQVLADPSAEAERRRKADSTRPPGAPRPLSVYQECQAWVNTLTADFRRGNNDAGLLLLCCFFDVDPVDAGPAWQPVVLELAVGIALHEHDAKLARSLDQAIDRHNKRGLLPPMPLVRYVNERPSAWPRGRSRLDNFDRDVALAREAFEWRLNREDDFNWQHRHQDLADAAACIDWTRWSLTDTLDLIEAEERYRPWSSTEISFDASDAWRRAYQEPSLDANRRLARGGLYLEHFRALLVDNVAALCMGEWERRLAARP